MKKYWYLIHWTLVSITTRWTEVVVLQ